MVDLISYEVFVFIRRFKHPNGDSQWGPPMGTVLERVDKPARIMRNFTHAPQTPLCFSKCVLQCF